MHSKCPNCGYPFRGTTICMACRMRNGDETRARVAREIIDLGWRPGEVAVRLGMGVKRVEGIWADIQRRIRAATL